MPHDPADQPTLSDGTVTLRAWREDDLRRAAAAGRPEAYAEGAAAAFVVETAERPVGAVELRRADAATGDLTWWLFEDERGQGWATRAVRVLADWALTETGQGGLGLGRVEAHVDPGNDRALRVATRSGLRKEGVRRGATGEHVVLARLGDDPPLSDPESFRALLNSFLPRKRAIGQMLLRDEAGRVLLCRLTYKKDWDLPGGVVEVGESPQLAAAREVEEELGLTLSPGRLLLTDWLPPWGGWDDALCLVFDGGTHDSAIAADFVKQAREIRDAQFCTLEQVQERCADFTARRVVAALRGLEGGAGPAYTESGR